MDKTNTPDEIVDLVNENDEVVGQATKREVNSNPDLIHREVAVLVYDNSNRIYIQQRSKNKKAFPLLWIISVAGHVPAVMLPIDAAHMELGEELGFDAELVFSYKQEFKYEWERHFAYLYLCKLPDGTEISLDMNEAEQGRFVNKAELEEMIANGEKIEKSCLDDFYRFWDSTLPRMK